MGKIYKVTATVVIAKEIEAEFEDDGATELTEQANEAIRYSDGIPLSMHHDIEEVSNMILTEK